MANRSNHPVSIAKTEVELLFARASGDDDDDLINLAGDVVSAVRDEAGIFDLTFRHSYPEGLIPIVQLRGAGTDGLQVRVTAWDPKAGTMTLKFVLATVAEGVLSFVATDPAAADVVEIFAAVRNSGRNGYS